MRDFLEFKDKWQIMPMQEKFQIAMKTDALNNKGAILCNSGMIVESIKYFKEALEVMPINDDAIPNLIKCYKRLELYLDIPNLLKKLYILNPSDKLKEKIIAFNLLLLIIENFENEYDMGIVGLSKLISTINCDYDIGVKETDIENVYNKINGYYSADILSWGYQPDYSMGLMSSEFEKCYKSEINVSCSSLKNELNRILNW